MAGDGSLRFSEPYSMNMAMVEYNLIYILCYFTVFEIIPMLILIIFKCMILLVHIGIYVCIYHVFMILLHADLQSLQTPL